MNTREQFLAVMAFEPGVRTMKWEFGYWANAIRRWYGEGLERRTGFDDRIPDGEGVTGPGLTWRWDKPRDFDVLRACRMDDGMERVPINNLFCPAFEEEVLEDHGSWVVRRDDQGITRREPRDRSSLPRYLSWPVRTRDDWERLKAERLQPGLAGRWMCPDWPAQKVRLKQRTFPLGIGGSQGFFGTARNLLGEENLLTGFYDDPDLVRAIMHDLCDFWIALYGNVLDEIDCDQALIWEDMSFKNGPLISPAMVRRFMLPEYRRLTGFLRERGIRVILLDTDGDCWQLIPIFLEGGVTGLYPFEVAAGMDVVDVRQAFPKLQMMGGIDKMAVAGGPPAIRAELVARVPALLELGGYVPFIDHYVPPDISWQDFCYYRQTLNEMIDRGGAA